MARVPLFCSQCSVSFQIVETVWPKICMSCGHQEWGNPLPVALAILPIGDQVILIRRNLSPGFGKWGFPGGFVNHRETPEMAAARETAEETRQENADMKILRPGLQLKPDVFEHFRTIGDPEVNLTLMAYVALRSGAEIADWCIDLATIPDSTDLWNSEVQAIGLFGPADLSKLDIAFPFHAHVLEAWFAR